MFSKLHLSMNLCKPNRISAMIRPLFIGGGLALMCCNPIPLSSDVLALGSPNSACFIQEDDAKKTADEKTADEPPAETTVDGGKENMSAEERRRAELMKGRENENEDRPEKPTFKDRPKSTGAISNITFDDIKFDIEKGQAFERTMLTDAINAIDGKRVNLRGFIRPSTRQKGLTKFVFVRDNKECCFGPGAALYDCVLVQLTNGQKSDYTVRPVTIEGDFYLKEYKGPDGKVWAIYRMTNSNVK